MKIDGRPLRHINIVNRSGIGRFLLISSRKRTFLCPLPSSEILLHPRKSGALILGQRRFTIVD